MSKKRFNEDDIRRDCFADMIRVVKHAIEDCPTKDGKDDLRSVGRPWNLWGQNYLE